MHKISKPNKYNDEMIIEATLLAQSNMTNTEIAETLGIQYDTLVKWKKLHPIIHTAISRGREIAKSRNSVQNLHEYIFNHLPEELQQMWEDLVALEERNAPRRFAEKMLKNKGRHARQQIYIHALTASNWNQSYSARLAGVSLRTLREWKEDPDFQELLLEVNYHRKNFFENALLEQVDKGKLAAIMYANKTQNRDRGWGNTIQVEHSGTINHEHAIVDVDKLKLPLELRAKILEAIELAHPDRPKLVSQELEDIIEGEIIEDELDEDDEDE